MKKVQSTIWLDLLTYIILPLVVLMSAYNVISAVFYIKWGLYTAILMLVEVSLIIFYSFTVYHSHNRTLLAPKLLRALFWVTAFQASFDFANSEHINKGYNLFLMFGIYFAACYIVWIRTNETYLQNRISIFGKETSLKKNYRCTECKRLVPIGSDCPHCKKEKNVKEEKEKKKVKEKKEEKDTTKKKVDKKSTEKED